MSHHEQDRTKTQRGQAPRQDRALTQDLPQDAGQTGRLGQNMDENPGQSLSPYQQGQQGINPPIPANGQPQALFAQSGYGSQRVRGQDGGTSGVGYGSGQDESRQSDPTDGQGRGARFGGSFGGPDRAQAWGLPQQQAVTEGWGDQRQALHQQDRHYQSWRERQNRQFDADWDAFNRERQSSFDDEFETWRNSRATKGIAGAADPDAEASLASPEAPSPGGSDLGSVTDS